MASQIALGRLLEASRALENEEEVVRLAAEAMWEACPRGLGLVYTIRGRPAKAVGAAAGVVDGAAAGFLDLDRFRRLYEDAALYYDRYRVERSQREHWIDLPRPWFRSSDFYPVFRPFGAMGRRLACVGSHPVGCLGVLLPDGQPDLTPEEQARARVAAGRAAGAVRLAALLAQARPSLDAVDHLMGSRRDAAFLLSAGGRILASSPAGRQALAARDGLAGRLAAAVRSARSQAYSITDPVLGRELHVTPCSPRGASSAYLAVLGASRPRERDLLSPRQTRLLDLLALGLGNAAIAERMGIAASTVKTMLERLYRRAGVSGRVALLRWAGSADPS